MVVFCYQGKDRWDAVNDLWGVFQKVIALEIGLEIAQEHEIVAVVRIHRLLVSTLVVLMIAT